MKRAFRILKRFMIISSGFILLLLLITFGYMRQAKFGKAPAGERLERMRKSPNFRDGRFQNILETPTMAEGYSIWGEIYKQLFQKTPRLNPTDVIPSVKNDLKNLPADASVLVWFGHSSYFLQLNGLRFLVDPVFSGNASPIPGSVKAFKGTDVYSVNDLPEIDYLLISHDHYDHLDYETVLALKNKTRNVFCGLGVGAHFEYWGYPADKINEVDWHEKRTLEKGLSLHAQPTRHKSGRGFRQDNTLWLSFIIKSRDKTIYIGGDSGYGPHFAGTGTEFGPIDLAIIENGQYNEAWHYIHCLPAEVLQAGKDLKAKRIFPVHSSKFVLGRHAWDEPLIALSKLAAEQKMPLMTPLIGEIVDLNDSTHVFKQWWKGIN